MDLVMDLDRCPDTRTKQPGDGFTGREVADLIDASYRQCDYWARLGLLRPSLADARGSGSRRRYSEADVELGLAVVQMFRLRIDAQQIEAAARLVSRRRVAAAGEWLIVPLLGEPIRLRVPTLPDALPSPCRLIRLAPYQISPAGGPLPHYNPPAGDSREGAA